MTDEQHKQWKKDLEELHELRTENKELREAMLNMCFCKRRICKRCGFVEEIPDRCKNEQIRDKIFRKLSKP